MISYDRKRGLRRKKYTNNIDNRLSSSAKQPAMLVSSRRLGRVFVYSCSPSSVNLLHRLPLTLTPLPHSISTSSPPTTACKEDKHAHRILFCWSISEVISEWPVMTGMEDNFVGGETIGRLLYRLTAGWCDWKEGECLTGVVTASNRCKTRTSPRSSAVCCRIFRTSPQSPSPRWHCAWSCRPVSVARSSASKAARSKRSGRWVVLSV